MSDDEIPDLLTVLDQMQPFVETVRGMVALFVNDGFTDDQARDLVAASFRSAYRDWPVT